MDYISVKEAANKFDISQRRVQKLCESNRIDGCKMLSGVWLIPDTATKPCDERFAITYNSEDLISLADFCQKLSISLATGRNWVKTNKIQPQVKNKNTLYFSNDYFQNISRDLRTGKNSSLKKRRNKTYVSGNCFYKSYVSDDSLNLEAVSELLATISKQNYHINDELIRLLLVDCAVKLFYSKQKKEIKNPECILRDFLQGRITFNEYDRLLHAFIEDQENYLKIYETHIDLFRFDFVYESSEDILGLLFISCSNIGSRKQKGAYFTPTSVVKNLIAKLGLLVDRKVLDPCCGSGNFLLQLPSTIIFNNIYGCDIDALSVQIARLNMALKYDAPVSEIEDHIIQCDYLTLSQKLTFDFILGNPPWGYKFSSEAILNLGAIYDSINGKSAESYDLFLERSIENLSDNGLVGFVLPEAFLNVKSHSKIRKIVLESCSIKSISYIGNAFDGVQCPSILLVLKKEANNPTTIGTRIETCNNEFTIKTERKLSQHNICLAMTDDEYLVLEKIKNSNNSTSLLNNADFALGIVTGNNKELIKKDDHDGRECILKGTDIKKFRVGAPSNYISFTPEVFQQVAPTRLYRSEEKLLYRFISNQLIFAYDDKQTLSLNSCNIVIPRIPNIDIKYVLAILNSRIAQFIFSLEFNSIKVLRSHIESIPIPFVTDLQQQEIIDVVNMILKCNNKEDVIEAYDTLDLLVSKLFNLNDSEYSIVLRSANSCEKFL